MKQTAIGDCYEIHGKAITLDREEGLLCHGTVWHQKLGWHGHAWIEHDGCVHDFANGHDETLPIVVYYALGSVKDVTRYTAEEAREMMLKFKYFGPWED